MSSNFNHYKWFAKKDRHTSGDSQRELRDANDQPSNIANQRKNDELGNENEKQDGEPIADTTYCRTQIRQGSTCVPPGAPTNKQSINQELDLAAAAVPIHIDENAEELLPFVKVWPKMSLQEIAQKWEPVDKNYKPSTENWVMPLENFGLVGKIWETPTVKSPQCSTEPPTPQKCAEDMVGKSKTPKSTTKTNSEQFHKGALHSQIMSTRTPTFQKCYVAEAIPGPRSMPGQHVMQAQYGRQFPFEKPIPLQQQFPPQFPRGPPFSEQTPYIGHLPRQGLLCPEDYAKPHDRQFNQGRQHYAMQPPTESQQPSQFQLRTQCQQHNEGPLRTEGHPHQFLGWSRQSPIMMWPDYHLRQQRNQNIFVPMALHQERLHPETFQKTGNNLTIARFCFCGNQPTLACSCGLIVYCSDNCRRRYFAEHANTTCLSTKRN